MQHWRKNRAPTRYSANLLVGGASHRITVVNVHEDGAGVAGAPPLSRGATVILQIMHHRVPSKVAWAKADSAGLTFQTRLSAQLLGTLRRLVGR